MTKSINIKLKHRYKGPLSNFKVLQAGEYNGDDLPEGLAEYLVENDHAEVLGSQIARAIDVVQAASTEVKQAIANMLEQDLAVETKEEFPVDDAIQELGEVVEGETEDVQEGKPKRKRGKS